MTMETTSRYTQTPTCLPPLLSSMGVDDIEAHRRHEQQLHDPIVPGPFVVLQGMSGDGMQNTIDYSPSFLQRQLCQNVVASGNVNESTQHMQEGVNEEDYLQSDDSSYLSNRGGEVTQSSNSTESSFQQFDEGDEDSEFHHVQPVPEPQSDTPNARESNASAEDRQQHQSSSDSSSTSAMLSSLGSSSSSEQRRQRQTTENPIPAPRESNTIHQQSMEPADEMNPSILPPLPPANASNAREESFIMVQQESGPVDALATAPSPPRTRRSRRNREQKEIAASLRRWHRECREREETELREMQMVTVQRRSTNSRTNSRTANASPESNNRRRRRWRNLSGRWWQREGKLIVFSSLPTSSSVKDDSDHERETDIAIVGDLHPGSTILGSEIFTIDAKSVPSEQEDLSATAQNVKYDFLRIEAPLAGYVLYRQGRYNYVANGLPTSYCQPNEWLWRVVSPEGAYVRRGLELNSRHITTLPHGSLVKVTRKTVNAMGLSRLRIIIDSSNHDIQQQQSTTNSRNTIEGWVSEMLNPLSGQQGPIMQPLPFPVPSLYRVTLSEGAVIRYGVELSSAQIRVAPAGSILKIVGRAFSEHPADQCIERLRLAGEGGWVSVRLNRPPPLDQLVVELVGIDGSFEPENAGKFHLYAQREVVASHTAAAAVAAVSSRHNSSSDEENTHRQNATDADIEQSDESATTENSIFRRQFNTGTPTLYGGSNYHAEDRCLICLTEERTATIVHGGTGHVACCLMCARILKARGDKCPVCRLPIDSVIQQFWA